MSVWIYILFLLVDPEDGENSSESSVKLIRVPLHKYGYYLSKAHFRSYQPSKIVLDIRLNKILCKSSRAFYKQLGNICYLLGVKMHLLCRKRGTPRF